MGSSTGGWRRARPGGGAARLLGVVGMAVAGLLGAACGTSAPTPTANANATSPTPTPTAASHPCATTTAPPTYHHVVWIVMENRAYRDVVHAPGTGYLDALGRACGVASDAGVTHPSLPNYLALTSGSTHGVTDDADPGSHPLAGPSIFSLLGRRWRSLEQGMHGDCARSAGGLYAPKHNPAAYYTDLTATCATQDVPLDVRPDLSAAFTLITPDLCSDMHDCSTATGEGWLAREVPLVVDSPQYRAGHTALFVTWDENDSPGDQVATFVVAPSVPAGTHPGAAYTHYSLLRTTEELLGLRPLLGAAATAPSMAGAFHL